jgi:hypothetical protein
MSENHTATVVLVVAALFALAGVVQVIRGAVLLARARRATIMDLFDGWPQKTRAHGISAFRMGAVAFVVALAAFMLVQASNTHY